MRRSAFELLDDLGTGVVLLLALLLGTALAVGLLVGMPLSVSWNLYKQGHVAAAGLVALLLVLAIGSVVRDLRTGRLSWLSAGLLAIWTLCIAYVGVRLVFDL